MYTQHTYMHHLHMHINAYSNKGSTHMHKDTGTQNTCTHSHTHSVHTSTRAHKHPHGTHKMSHTGHDEAPKPWEMLLQPVFPVIFVFPEPPHRGKCIGVENRKSNCPKIFPQTETSVDCAVRLSSLFPSSFILKSVEEENASNQAQVELIHVKREAEAPLGRRTSCVRREGRTGRGTPSLSA